MIRVTLKNGQVKEFDNTYISVDGYLTTYSCKENFEDNIYLKDIVKIEKQVKDLTLEEAHKLELGIHYFDSWYKVYQIVDGQAIYPKMNDYIDITELIKGE